MRNVEEVFSALKENLDQIMTNLQDGILLYTHDARAVLVSDSVERFLGVSRAEILGCQVARGLLPQYPLGQAGARVL